MRGGMISQFSVGQLVQFFTKDKGHKLGRISKLHASSASGVAEIKPNDGTKKVSRRLMFVLKTAE